MSTFKDDGGYYGAADHLIEYALGHLETAEIDDNYLISLKSCLILAVDRRDNRVGSGSLFAGILLMIKRVNVQNLSESQRSKYDQLIISVNRLIDDPRNENIDNLEKLIP